MTRIRRINVSQVEGNGADNTDINQIRPNGETAFYLDNNSKLTLMMFDGVRTHQKSKVLNPGVLFGSNADSGDGTSLDTIKLVPDAALFYNGSQQYLIVDPTGPNHIHLRAGGTQDASTADLYLGGELTNVRVSDTLDDVVIRTSILGEGIFPYSWTFDNTGKLTLPGTLEFSNGTLATGGGVLTTPNTDYIIGTQNYQTASANCAIAVGSEFVADTEFNDDITVVQVGWTVVVDGTTYTVTSIDPAPPANQYRITAAGATFVQGTTYTFTSPTPVTKTWSFGSTGTLATPAGGTISHNENDLMMAVTGLSDVIVLRTVGGDTVMNSDGSIEISGPITQGDAKLSFNENNSTNVYLTPTTDDTSAVFINAVGSQVYGKETVSILGGAGLQAAFDLFLESRQLLRDVFDALQSEPGFPWGITQPAGGDTYDELLSLPPDTFPNQDIAVVRADSLNQAYSTYQTLYNNSEVTVAVGDRSWRFDSMGVLHAPNQAPINFYDDQGAVNGAIGGDNAGHVVFGAGANKGIKLFTDSVSNLWTFGTDGSLTFPDATAQTTAYTGSYTPATPADWNGTPPTTIAAAIDRLAARIKLIDGGTGA